MGAGKAARVQHCSHGAAKLPPGFMGQSGKEARLLAYLDDYARVFRELYPYRWGAVCEGGMGGRGWSLLESGEGPHMLQSGAKADWMTCVPQNRRPLYLAPPNECSVPKFVCTTLRPSLLPYPELYSLEGAARRGGRGGGEGRQGWRWLADWPSAGGDLALGCHQLIKWSPPPTTTPVTPQNRRLPRCVRVPDL
jgi:hypothetical protein